MPRIGYIEDSKKTPQISAMINPLKRPVRRIHVWSAS